MNKINLIWKSIVGSILIYLTICSANVFAQTTFYVATTGSDETGTGTIEMPFATLQYALNQCSDGDIIIMRGGNYTSNEIRIDRSNITIRSFDNEWAVITSPLNIEDATSCIWYHEPEIVGGTLERLEIVGGYLYAIKFESNWDWGSPIPERRGVSNITIRNCKIHSTGRDCLKVTPACNNLTIENCEIYNSGIGPANQPEPNAEGLDCVNGNNLTVRNCYIHDISTNGLYSKGGSRNTLFEGNLIMNCGESGILLGFYTDEEWFDTLTNPKFYEIIDGIARNNIVIGTKMTGIGMYASLNSQLVNNTVINTAQEILYPLFLGPGLIWVEKYNRDIYPPNENIKVLNNVFMQAANLTNTMVRIRYTDDDTTTNMRGVNDINNNIYYHPNGALFEDGITGEAQNLFQWRNLTQFDALSIEADPKLDNNYHISVGSPCIDNGKPIDAVKFDYDGGSRDASPDIGADEWGAGDILTVPPSKGTIGTGNDKKSTGIYIEPVSISELLANNPNPVFDNTSLTVKLAESSNIKLSVIDLRGFEVMQIYKGILESGEYKFNIDCSSFSTGIYFIRMEFDGERIEKKFIVVR